MLSITIHILYKNKENCCNRWKIRSRKEGTKNIRYMLEYIAYLGVEQKNSNLMLIIQIVPFYVNRFYVIANSFDNFSMKSLLVKKMLIKLSVLKKQLTFFFISD